MRDEERRTREAIDEVVEELLALATDARRAFREGDTAQVALLYEDVRARADEARGPVRALYEVAEAFLGALVRGVHSRDTLTLLRFAERSPEAASFLAAAASGNGVSLEARDQLPDELREETRTLESCGVLVAGGERLTVRAGLRPTARDLAVPPLLRMWEQVQAERSRVAWASASASGRDRAQMLAGLLGITEPQASAHLAEFPLENRVAPAPRRGASVPKVTYRRDLWKPQHGTALTSADAPDEFGVSELVTVGDAPVPSDVVTSRSELN